MGVDYDANYGIGYQVEAGEHIPQEELDDGLVEYLDGNLGDEFFYFEVGEGCYTDEINEVFIGIEDPFNNGLDLTGKKEKLDLEIYRLKLKVVSDFGEIGGLHTW